MALTALVQRLTPGEAEDLLSQLSSPLRARLPLPSGPRKEITRQTMEEALAKRLDVTPERAARILEAFGATLARNVS